MTFLLAVHSFVRWLIVLVAVVALVKFLVGWLGRQQWSGMDRGLTAGFSGLMDLQVTLGLIVLLWDGFTGAGFPAYRIEHAVTLIIAAVVAHLPARWKEKDAATRFRNGFFTVLITSLLIYIGVGRVGGWLF